MNTQLPADMETLRLVMPQIAVVAEANHLQFNGTQEGYVAQVPECSIPSMLLFTDREATSKSFGATFAVPIPATPAQVVAKMHAVRAQFANESMSWGDPAGGDSGHDYAKI